MSDAHLGAPYHKKNIGKEGFVRPSHENPDNDLFAQHEIERKLCRWFDMVKTDAKTIYLLGDIFDYWFEYKTVVPRGFTRFLGKLSEMTDMGIEVHFFIGNHDIWLTDYLSTECGVIVHTEPFIVNIDGQQFFLAHGDGLGDDSRSFKFLRKLFHSKICRIPFAAIHPKWTISFAHAWARHSRESGEMLDYMGEDKEHLITFAKKELKRAPDLNFFLFGHRHIMLDLMLSRSARIVILGDWIRFFSYGIFDGENFSLEVFEEEEA